MMARGLLCKLLQRKTYDALAKKYTLLFLFMGFVIITVAALHFWEAVLDWSKEKYSSVFVSFRNNIAGKNYQHMLCQSVPIDVVYTWVNGTDPKHIIGLELAKEEYGFIKSHANCTSLCVESNIVIVRPNLPKTFSESDLDEGGTSSEGVLKRFDLVSPYSNSDNVTALMFSSVNAAKNVLNRKFLMLDTQKYTFSCTLITDNWLSRGTVMLDDVFIMSNMPANTSDDEIMKKLPPKIHNSIIKIFHYEDKNAAVLIVNNTKLAGVMESLNHTILDEKISVTAASLFINPPPDHEDVSSSRFVDNDELRYSLRSIEKHAPWIHHVFIVTNGQIPHWLNLDNPRITIVTHEEIFPNKSHLPTFSSPAIECHLHKIPNLSTKYLYLNDDVMFGKDVWPEDFYTHTNGQKVYMSWPVPNCADGCPASWIRDGYCDQACNNSECQWDGGDCLNDAPMPSHPSVIVHQNGLASLFRGATNSCHNECANAWLADRYCDKACNVKACGFDAGDCGVTNYDKLYQITFSESQNDYQLPRGENLGYFNLTEFVNKNYTITDAFYEENPVIRALAISTKHLVLSIVLYPHYNATRLIITLKGERNKEPFEKLFYLNVRTEGDNENIAKKQLSTLNLNVSSSAIAESVGFEEFNELERSPKVLLLNNSHIVDNKYSKVDFIASSLPDNVTKLLDDLYKKLLNGEVTEKGFLKEKAIMVDNYVQTYHAIHGKVPNLVYDYNFHIIFDAMKTNIFSTDMSSQFNRGVNADTTSPENVKVVNHVIKDVGKHDINMTLENRERSKHVETGLVQLMPAADILKSAMYSYMQNSTTALNRKSVSYQTPSVKNRHLLDTFGDSLRHVNKLYNEAFGFEARKVPSHIAHFIDRDVMSRLYEQFQTAFAVTSSHRIRSSNDMQFAFSYYYYLMSEMEDVSLEYIFDMFDVDYSGTWSDREIRTLLARLHDLPLDFSSVTEFEQHIVNCSETIGITVDVSTPLYERYYESKLPLVSKELVLSCPVISNALKEHFGRRKRNRFEILGEDEVAFKMIHNNVSHVMVLIDDIRKNPRKFVCLNDNMKHGSHEADVVRAVMQDFYESLFPQRSQFELPPDYRNRFLYTEELKEWRKTRDLIRVVIYLCLIILIIFSAVSFWYTEATERIA